MSLRVIYLTRHGFRSNWTVDSQTGEYASNIPSPTGIAGDPALASYGVQQSRELAAHLQNVSPSVQRIYSSPFYRCLQTVSPTVDAISTLVDTDMSLKIRAENGLGEWYGVAKFNHPSPAEPVVLKELFPQLDENYEPFVKPCSKGETIHQLHDRCAHTMKQIIEQCDQDGIEAILLCTHAATLIAIGRVLTGQIPEDVKKEDFRPFTCGLSCFVRKSCGESSLRHELNPNSNIEVSQFDWKENKGVGGSSWEVKLNGDCSFLSGGEERGWRFSGNESFDLELDKTSTIDAGSGLGVIVKGNNTHNAVKPPKL
ncbi:BgTH12-02849 [Blumeria graminis f. sp. triticale]|uniref:BgTH12-02849 n=3 Tax=Blumeria graminis TaxID=34373 RepID=A0A9W4GFU3_BLUGR|nr:BgTH12-02849 [Blumeria graminis f. sp. triticale]